MDVMIWVLVLFGLVISVSAARFQSDAIHWRHKAGDLEARLVSEEARREHADEKHTEFEAALREQIQHLAQQLATLRVEKNAAPEQDRFVEDPKPPEPLSQQLTDFLLAIEYEDARQLVEEQIDVLRSQDHTDEQIYDIVSKGND